MQFPISQLAVASILLMGIMPGRLAPQSSNNAVPTLLILEKHVEFEALPHKR
jgi:hypothetical protein